MDEQTQRELELLQGRLAELEDRIRDTRVESAEDAPARLQRLAVQAMLLRGQIARLRVPVRAAQEEAAGGMAPSQDDARAALVEELLGATRALTLHRPWDMAILRGTKWVENRGWKLKEPPGWIYVHGGAMWDEVGEMMLRTVDGLRSNTMEAPPGVLGGLMKVTRFVVGGEADLPFTGEPGAPGGPMVWKEAASIGWAIEQVVAFDGMTRPRCPGRQNVWTVAERPLHLARELIREGLFTHRYTALYKKPVDNASGAGA